MSRIREIGFVSCFAVIAFGAAWWTSRTDGIGTQGGADSSNEVTASGFSPERIDLGDLRWGDQVPLDLTFWNKGNRPLVIKDVSSSCGCMLSDKEQYRGEIVAPGADHAIRLRLDVGLNPGGKSRTVTPIDPEPWPCYTFGPPTIACGGMRWHEY